MDPEVIEVYADLFFNVLDRKDDLVFLQKILGSGNPSSLFLSKSSLPTEEESLLAAGSNGKIADVLQIAGLGKALEVLRQDLANDPVPNTVECVQHPMFLLTGADGRSLKSLVGECHQRTALAVKPKL